MITSEAFREHIGELERRAVYGDSFAAQSLMAIALIESGWRYGDPDPPDNPNDGGGEVIELSQRRPALAA
jgi:hypothetical protein